MNLYVYYIRKNKIININILGFFINIQKIIDNKCSSYYNNHYNNYSQYYHDYL